MQAELQQQVEGMSSQLNSLEACLKASVQQMGSLQLELASLGNPASPAAAIQVNGKHPPNLPQGAFFEAADLTSEEEAEQEQIGSQLQPGTLTLLMCMSCTANDGPWPVQADKRLGPV